MNIFEFFSIIFVQFYFYGISQVTYHNSLKLFYKIKTCVRGRLIKGTLWKFENLPIFSCSYENNISNNVLIPRIVGLFTIVFFLKSRLIFNVFCCFGVFVNNPCLTKVGVSQNVKWFVMPNLRYTIFMWRFIYFMNFISALCLVPTAGITFVALSDEIWSPQIHRSKFVARAFPPIAHF